jgi:hypothetical protein
MKQPMKVPPGVSYCAPPDDLLVMRDRMWKVTGNYLGAERMFIYVLLKSGEMTAFRAVNPCVGGDSA